MREKARVSGTPCRTVQKGIADINGLSVHSLQNAANVASLMLTAQRMIAEKREEKLDMTAMPPAAGIPI
ncbi:MAG: hypothetical protein ABFD82_18095 [Syntrophaceae bacterium]